MDAAPKPNKRARFGHFEVDFAERELRKQGTKIKLNEKPFQVLELLLERAGELVRREDLRNRLWPADTYVDFDANLNTALSNLRRALADSSDNSVLIETVPRQGYRFVAPVSPVDETGPAASSSGSSLSIQPEPSSRALKGADRRWIPRVASAVTAALAVVVSLGLFAYFHWGSRLAQANGRPRKITILVTPFENLSGDSSQDYLSDGLTDEMITRLGKDFPDHLSVIARSTAMQYKRTQKSIQTIAKEQHVDYILEGTFRRQDDHVRITAQLYKTSDLSSRWAEAYERNASDLLNIQSEVANRIVQALSLQLLPAPTAHPAAISVDPKAYDSYLRGLFECNRSTLDGTQKGVQFLRQAIRIQPGYARAYGALASCLDSSYFLGFLSPEQAYEQAEAAAQKALSLDDSLVDAHLTLASILYEHDWNWAESEVQFRRALELNPSSVKAHQLYTGYLMFAGRSEEALDEIRKAQQLDPASMKINSMIGLVYLQGGQYERAAEQCKEVEEIEPGFSDAHYCVGLSYYYRQQYPQALIEFEKVRQLNADPNQGLLAVGATYAASGDRTAALRVIDELKRKSRQSYVSPYGLADIYSRLGEKDQAFALLRKAFDQRSTDLLLLASDPDFNELHGDPQFQQMIVQLGFPDSSLASMNSHRSSSGR